MKQAWNKNIMVWKSCATCGCKIRQWLKYCSSFCYYTSKQSTLIKKICLPCGTYFIVTLHRKKKKYCSKKCLSVGRSQNLIGKTKGRKHTPEALQKITQANKLNALTKEKNPNWKGGITSQNKLDRSRFQQTMQRLVFERDNYICQLCEAKGNLQVDHIKSWSQYPDLRFNMNNCRTLCAPCHYFITFGKPMPNNVKSWGHNAKFYKGGQIL